MKIFSENDPSLGVDDIVEDAVKQLYDFGKKVVANIKNDYLPLLDDFIKNMTGEIKGVTVGKEVDELDMETLIDFAKKYIVPNSNEIVAINTRKEDEFFIYLAYSKDRQLLKIEDNKYLIIKAKSLSKEVEQLFEESGLIILK